MQNAPDDAFRIDSFEPVEVFGLSGTAVALHPNAHQFAGASPVRKHCGHARPEPRFAVMVLDGDHEARRAGPDDGILVKGFYRGEIYDRQLDVVLPRQFLAGFERKMDGRAAGCFA